MQHHQRFANHSRQCLPGPRLSRIAGLKTGDVITSIDKIPVRSASDLRNKVGLLRVGDTAELAMREAVAGPEEFEVQAKASPKRLLLTLIRDGHSLFLVVQ